MVMPLEGEGGKFTGDALRAHMRDPADRHEPRSRLVTVEQTTNLGGGRVWPLAQIEEVLDVAKEFDLRTHLDGARLLNATVASGESAAAYAAGFETAWIDFSKGLGAPIGACLAGSDELIEEAWRYKQMLGGSMRQAGFVAAAARYGLQHNVERLADDHANAKFLAEGLAEIDGVEIDPSTVETNIVIFDVADADRPPRQAEGGGRRNQPARRPRPHGHPPRRRPRRHRNGPRRGPGRPFVAAP